MKQTAWWFLAMQIGPPVVLALALGDGSIVAVLVTCAWIGAWSTVATIVHQVTWRRETDKLLAQPADATIPRLSRAPAVDPWIFECVRDLRREESAILAALDDGCVDEARRLIRDHFEEDIEQMFDGAALADSEDS